MADIAYSSSIQNKVATRLFQTTYSDLTTPQKTVIDGSSASSPPTEGVAEDAWNYIGAYAQWVYVPSTAGYAPAEWERWLVARMVYLAAEVFRPDRAAYYKDIEKSEMQACLTSYIKTAMDATISDLATTTTIKNIRYSVMSAAIRHNPPIFIDPADIDAATVRTIRDLWNRADWNWKRRPVTMTVTPYDLTDATWTSATKTLAHASIPANIPIGTAVNVTDGTNAVDGRYYVATNAAAGTLTLTADIGATTGSTDIDFDFVTVVFNFAGTETFHKSATRRWYYTSTSESGQFIEWSEDGDAFIRQSIAYGTGQTGTPSYVRFSRTGNTQMNWEFAPEPNATVTLRGEAFIRYPGDPSSATDTTVFDYFPKEFHPLIRDVVYATVMERYEPKEGAYLRRQWTEDLERIAPLYSNQGRFDADTAVRDQYHDHAFQAGGGL